MWCAIYKSAKKAETYLYIEERGDFSRVPEALLSAFGEPQFVMLLQLHDDRTLAREPIEQVRVNLREQGFHLQMPPRPVDLHKEHLARQGIVKE